MAIIKCPYCKKPTPSGSPNCLNCGKEINLTDNDIISLHTCSTATPKNKKLILIIIIALLLVIGGTLLFFFAIYPKINNIKERASIYDAKSIEENTIATTTTTAITTIAESNITTTATTVTTLPPDIKNLKWGMSVDDVKANVPGTPIKEQRRYESYKEIDPAYANSSDFEDGMELEYSNIPFKNYISSLGLCITDKHGLEGVTFTIDGDLYQTFYNEAYANYGEPDDSFYSEYVNSYTAWWYNPTENYQIYIMSYKDDTTNIVTTRYSYFPTESFINALEAQTPKHLCTVDGCNSEGTKSIIGFSGETEYYCQKHYDEMQGFVDNIDIPIKPCQKARGMV